MKTFMVYPYEVPQHRTECRGLDIYATLPYHLMMADDWTKDFPHFVRILTGVRATLLSDVPSSFKDNLRDGSQSEPSEWCIENFGPAGIRWRRVADPRMIFYFFRNQEDAAMFKLTWADFR